MDVNLKIYPSGSDFLKDLRADLEAYYVINSLILGIASREDEGLYYAVKKGEELLLCGMMPEKRNILLAFNNKTSIEAIHLLSLYLVDNQIRPPGVLGTNDLCEAFLQRWEVFTSAQSVLDYNEMIHEATKVNQIRDTPGQLVQADLTHLQLVTDWAIAFQEDVGLQEGMERAQTVAYKKLERKEYFLWECNDQLVSMAATTRPTRNTISINSVYTPPEHRNQGFGTSCVHALTERMLKHYPSITLFTDLKNPTSNSIYKQIGYVPVKEFLQMKFIYRD